MKRFKTVERSFLTLLVMALMGGAILAFAQPPPADSDNDGLPDAWEQQYLGALSLGAADDPGAVGRTLLQSFQQGLSPWPAAGVATGLRAWFRADLGLAKDGSGQVSAWADLSGNGAHVVQDSVPSRQPHFVANASNSQPAVEFNGSSVLTSAGNVDLQNGSGDVTIIAVGLPAATQQAYSSIVDLSADTSHGYVLGQLGGETNQYRLWFQDSTQSSGWQSTPAASAGGGGLRVLSVVKNGTAATSYVNGSLQGSATVSQSLYAPAAPLALGNRASALYGFTGQLTEVLIYNRALSDTERQQIETGLLARYINPDNDADGLPDAWELKYLGSVAYGASADPGSVGRTLLQSYQQSLNPWPASDVSTGLQAWYRADLGVTKDGANKVLAWTDLSGHGAHVLQTGTPSQVPLWNASGTNGRPTVDFDGSMVLRTADAADVAAGSDSVTVVVVAIPAATQPAYSSLVDLSSDTAQGFVFGQLGNDTNQYRLWFQNTDRTSGWQSSPIVGASNGALEVMSVVKNGASVASYRNGLLQGQGSVSQSIFAPAAKLAVGNRASALYGFSGQIAEVRVYNRAVSPAELQVIQAGLLTRYVNLDTDADGLPDAWERQYLGTLSYGPAADPGGVGRTLLASFQGNLSPWPAAVEATGLRAWYRADLGITKDGANKISSWADLSGNGSHVVQTANAARQPAWIPSALYGHPAVAFDGSMVLTSPASLEVQSGSDDVTIIAVTVPAATQPAYGSIVDLSSDTAQGYVLGQLGNDTNQYRLWFQNADRTSGWQSSPLVGASSGSVQVVSVVKNGSTASSFLNGIAQGSGTVTPTLYGPAAALAVGNRASALYGFNGQIAEVLVYNRALSDSVRHSLEAGLLARYVNPDSDGDGLPDIWEQQYFGSLAYNATDDPGVVGRTLLQSFQQTLSPWPTATVSSGLSAWYRADLGVTKDGSNKVTRWTDLSGSGDHLVQTAFPVRQPTWAGTAINGKPAVQFDGTMVLTSASASDLQAGSNDVTVVVVAVPAATQPGYSSIVDLSSDTAHGYVLGQLADETNQYRLWFQDATQTSGWQSSPAVTAISGGAPQVITVVKNGATASSYLNGSAQGSGTVSQTLYAPAAPVAVGNRASALYGFNGQIAEVLVYNRALGDAERQTIETALTTRYAGGGGGAGDADHNGLPDAWEIQYFGHTGNDPGADPDADGLSNLQEFQLGRNPTKSALPDSAGAVDLRIFSPAH